MEHKTELLLPAGSLERLRVAVLYGADAIYMGTPDLSLRTRSAMTLEDVREGVAFAHAHGKKVYLTLNLFSHNRDIPKLPAFIDTIRDMFAAIPRNGFDGIGDDCTVFPLGSGESLVFTADLLAENIHFLRRATSARELGRKSLAVNLSDVAAMGARPIATLLSLAIPHDLPEGWIEDFMEGYRDLSAQYDVGLVGGDTTASDSGLVVNVTAIGRIADSHIKRRSDARPGDLIAVGGSLGESGAGLRDILAGRYDTPLAQIHRNPAPQVAEGIWLGERPEVHAMMDISDGIASDLRHILHQSGVGAEVDTECIPTPVDLETAVSGGEDYKLLFTVAPESANTLLSNYRLRFGDEFHFIGRITGGNHLEWLRNGTPLPVDWQGFRHY